MSSSRFPRLRRIVQHLKELTKIAEEMMKDKNFESELKDEVVEDAYVKSILFEVYNNMFLHDGRGNRLT